MAESEMQAETFGFQTEARQLLQLMIHSLYSNRGAEMKSPLPRRS